jgi:predicted P-loop ATPase
MTKPPFEWPKDRPLTDEESDLYLRHPERFVDDLNGNGIDAHADMLVGDWPSVPPHVSTAAKLARIAERKPVTIIRPTWMEQMVVGSKSEPPAVLANVMVAMRSDPAIANAFAYNEMLRGVVLMHEIGDPADTVPARPITDDDVASLQEYLQNQGLTRLGKDTAHQAVDLRAREKSYHPLRDYLERLVWDKTPRAEKWFITYIGAEDTAYTRAVGKMFLVAMVARIYQPGCKVDYMPIIEGPQGLMKSSACAVIGGEYFSDNLPDLSISGKDASQHLRNKWLIEVTELHAMSRADNTLLKSFITRTHEQYRPSYGRKEVNEARQCLFIGTTNKQAYLRDESGGRRFWPLKANNILIDMLAKDRDQLFAEAVDLFAKGEKWWPDRDLESAYIKPEQDARFEGDAWEEKVAAYVLGKESVTVGDIGQLGLFLETRQFGRAEQNRIMAILEHLGWQRGKRTMHGRPWTPPTEGSQ